MLSLITADNVQGICEARTGKLVCCSSLYAFRASRI